MKASLLALLVLAAAPARPGDDALKSRELAAIAEEQALLQRQIKRLRQTMDLLVLRLEAEGRPRAVELLREGIGLLDSRGESTRALTLEEAMDDARQRLETGQVVQSIDSQEEVVHGLERLLAILMERGNLDGLEENLERIREMKALLQDLAVAEGALREATRDLVDDSKGEEQRGLEREIARAVQEQRALLAETERAGRESGALELEQIERGLERLREDLEADRGLLDAWDPQSREELAAAAAAVEEARRAEARALRLDETARALAELAAESSAEPRAAAERALESELERAERHARAGDDSAAKRTAQALREALEALRREDRSAAPAELERLARDLDAAAAEEARAAERARASAAQELAPAATRDDLAGLMAREVSESLAQADAADAAQGERARAAAAEATEEAARALARGLSDLERMPEALSGSQAGLAAEAERLARGLSTLRAGATPEGEEAGRRVSEAAEAMRRAAEEARRSEPESASASADGADRALEQALEALGRARAGVAAEESQRRAELQQELARRVGELPAGARDASLDAGAREALERALDRAAEAMRAAGEELEGSKSSAAVESQREAIEALGEAQRAARSGVRPDDAEGEERARELAREQERIREEILELAARDPEKKNPEALTALEGAREAAERARDELDGGRLEPAERSEEEVQRELDRARRELEEEEEQYERLRQEELLFRIAEEMKSALEAHRGQMRATTELAAELEDSERPSRSQRLRMRRIAREEETVAERTGEIAKALEDEGSAVFAEVLRFVETDLRDVVDELSDDGDGGATERVQALQRDVEERLEWLEEALREEQRRREQESQQQQQEPQQEQRPSENRLVQDSAELKLLRRMEVELQDEIDRLLLLYPELADLDPEDVNPLVLDQVMRVAVRHERTTELFTVFRRRLGVPDPADGPSPHGGGEAPDRPEEDR